MGAGNKMGAVVACLAAEGELLPADGMWLGVLQGASPGRGGVLGASLLPQGSCCAGGLCSARLQLASPFIFRQQLLPVLLLCGCFLPLRSTEPRVEGEAVLGVNPPAPGRH